MNCAHLLCEGEVEEEQEKSIFVARKLVYEEVRINSSLLFYNLIRASARLMVMAMLLLLMVLCSAVSMLLLLLSQHSFCIIICLCYFCRSWRSLYIRSHYSTNCCMAGINKGGGGDHHPPQRLSLWLVGPRLNKVPLPSPRNLQSKLLTTWTIRLVA